MNRPRPSSNRWSRGSGSRFIDRIGTDTCASTAGHLKWSSTPTIISGIPEMMVGVDDHLRCPAVDAHVSVPIRSMNREPEPRLHRFELGRGRFMVLAQPVKLVAKVHELLRTQSRTVVAVPWPAGDVDHGRQPVPIPVVRLVGMLPRQHLDGEVLRGIDANSEGPAHGSEEG